VNDDSAFVAGCLDKSVQIWSLSGDLIKRLEQHGTGVRSVDVSPDGKRLVSRSVDGATILWDTSDWKPTLTLLPMDHGSAEIYGSTVQEARFSPDGMRILSADKHIGRIWETQPASTRHESMALAQTVGDFVNGLFDEIGLPENIIESLSSDRTISGEFRRAALRSVHLAANNPPLLAKRAWETLMQSDATPVAYSNALILAKKALELDKENSEYRCAVAAALYRTGEYVEALALLKGLEEAGWTTAEEPNPVGPIFLAMAAFRGGELDLAKRTIAILEPTMHRPLWARVAGSLFEEAQELTQQAE
jgi:tetratricopeptide (TPR) repeat protein